MGQARLLTHPIAFLRHKQVTDSVHTSLWICGFLYQTLTRAVKVVSAALWNGGEGGIRTPETLARLTVFKTAAIDHSATSPYAIRVALAG
jgi:hypothetical protein